MIYALMIENYSGGLVSVADAREVLDKALEELGRKAIAVTDPEKWGTGKEAEAGQKAMMQVGGLD